MQVVSWDRAEANAQGWDRQSQGARKYLKLLYVTGLSDEEMLRFLEVY